MAITSYPFDPQDTSEADYRVLMEAIMETGVVSGLAATPGAGLQISIASGVGFVHGFVVSNSAAFAVNMTAADPALTRKDYIILKLDMAANTITIEKKDGTTAGGGTLPALTQNSATWEHPIAVITVPPAAVGFVAGNIQAYVSQVSRGYVTYANTTQRRNDYTRVLLGVNTTTKQCDYFDGAGNWTPLGVDWSAITSKPATFAPIIGVGAGDAVAGNDARLTNARTPTVHSINGAEHNGYPLTLANGGTGATTAAAARAALGVVKITVQTAATADPMIGNNVGDLLIEY